MRIIPLEKTELSLKQAAALAKRGPVILTRRGKPLAAVRDLSGSDWESVALANNPKFLALIEQARQSFAKNGGTALNEIRRDLGLARKAREKKRAGP